MAKAKTGRSAYESRKAKEIADRYFELDSSSDEDEAPFDAVDDGYASDPPGRRKAPASPTPKAKREPPKKLTEKEARFVDEYMVDGNATQAAIRAGYSAKTAAAIGAENLRKPHIVRALDARRKVLSAKAEWTAERVLATLGELLTADIADLYDEETGALKPVHEWPMAFRTGLVAGIDADEIFEGSGEDRAVIGITRKVKLADRTALLNMLGKHVLVQAWNLKKTVTHQIDPFQQIREEVQGTGLRPQEIEAKARDVTPRVAGAGLRPRE